MGNERFRKFVIFLVAELCATAALVLDKITAQEWWVAIGVILGGFTVVDIADKKLNNGGK